MTTATVTRTTSGPSILRIREVRALLAAPDRRTRRGKRDAALLAVLIGGGLRVGECCRLTVDSLETGKQIRLTFRTAKSRGRSRTVTLPTLPAKLLREWLEYSKPRLFIFEGRRHEALSVRQAERIATGYLRRIGRGDLHTHSLRHTVGAILTRESGGTRTAMRVLGHADQKVTERYYSQWDASDSDRAAQMLEEAMGRREK